MPYSEAELLDEIRAVAEAAETTGAPSLQDFREQSDIADTTVLRRFDSWQAAVKKAGFEPNEPVTEIPDEKLLTELQRVADEVNRVPTMAQMREQGNYAPSTYKNHFGSWTAALTEAFGETQEAGAHVSNEALLDELRRVADAHGSPPRFDDMRDHGSHRPRTYARRFGSWRDAIEAAGLEPPDARRIPTADLLADLRRLRDELGTKPKSTDVVADGEYGLATYQRRFGSWQAACDAAFDSAEESAANE